MMMLLYQKIIFLPSMTFRPFRHFTIKYFTSHHDLGIKLGLKKKCFLFHTEQTCQWNSNAFIHRLKAEAFRWCMVCYDRTIFGRDTTILKSGIWGCKKKSNIEKIALKCCPNEVLTNNFLLIKYYILIITIKAKLHFQQSLLQSPMSHLLSL